MATGARDGLPTLRTDRLVLRDWESSDAAPFAEMNADPEVMAHFPSVLGRHESDELIERIRLHTDAEGFGLWAIDAPHPDGGHALAGFVGLIRPPFVVPGRIEAGTVEVGWRLATWAWGRGFATEGASAALDQAFRRHGLDSVVSFTVADNHRSMAVMERIGLRRDPGRDFDHPRWEPGWGENRRAHLVWSIDGTAWSLRAGGHERR